MACPLQACFQQSRILETSFLGICIQRGLYLREGDSYGAAAAVITIPYPSPD
jgi:hypothetical protein